jgi:transcription antitermination factor NusG
MPQHEQAVTKQLEMRQIESFLPVYEETHIWKNRQRVKISKPLFPTYIFARSSRNTRSAILRAPGVIRIVGDSRGPIAIPDAEIEILNSDLCRQKAEPYRELVVGQRVQIKSGPMLGVQGTLVRKNNGLRFVVTLELINQHAALEVSADEVEPMQAELLQHAS